MDEIYKRLNDDTEVKDHSGDRSEIQEFFSGQTIFLTGSTGYVGKMLVEKLIRSCSDLKIIYFLVRSKKQTSAERMKQYFNDLIFDRMKREMPNYEKKVKLIEGDLMKENLGLSTEDRKKLIQETTLIYHNASNVKFDEKVSVSLRTNVFGTKYMLELAKQCERLKGFVYVSTAYTHSYMQHIDDKCYPPPVEMNVVDEILAVDEANPRGIDEEAMEQLRGRWPNNYSFTKSIAESLVEECGKQAPFACAIYRPSVIIPTYSEPIRGWCGNLNGPAGMIVGCGVGFIHAIPHGINPIDFTPIDMCVNALITCTWDVVANKPLREAEKETIVYNYGSSVEKPTNLQEFTRRALVRAREMGTMKIMGGFYVIYAKCIWQWWLLHILVHLFPALLADLVLLAKGQKPQMFAMWKLISKNARSLHFYTDGNWRIHVPRMRMVWDRLNERDAKLFDSDLRKFDWEEYHHTFWSGIRTYILNDPMSTAEAGSRLFHRLICIQRTIYYLGQALILYLVARWIFPNLLTTCPFA